MKEAGVPRSSFLVPRSNEARITKHEARLPAQAELPLSSVLSHTVFPGRSTLYVSEVARALSVTPQQVLDLIVCGDLEAVSISAARDATAKTSLEMDRAGRLRVPRTHWRVTVSGYDSFLRKRSNQNLT